jgi:hypothetical protein
MKCRNLVLLGIFRMEFVSSAGPGENKLLRASMPADMAVNYVMHAGEIPSNGA